MTDKDTITELDVFFAAARRETDTLTPDLTDRILRDAARIQVEATVEKHVPMQSPGLWQQLVGALGGWPAMGGLVAACATGVWIGLAPPDFVPDPLALVSETQSDINLLDTYDMSALLTEDQ